MSEDEPMQQKTLFPKPENKGVEALFSVSPAGETFPLPVEADHANEFRRLQKIVAEQRGLGREIVVVMGIGFVGAVMAGVIADSVDKKHRAVSPSL